jgi:hypothetical protein
MDDVYCLAGLGKRQSNQGSGRTEDRPLRHWPPRTR